MQIVPLGDAAIVVRVLDDFKHDPARAIDAVLHVRAQLCAAAIDGIADIAPAYTTVALFFDPARAGDTEALVAKIRSALAVVRRAVTIRPRTIEVPVCYDAEFASDLAEVATHARLSPAEVVRLHSRAKYLVSCLGFSPGFPYLSGLPREIATPRRSTPRTRVPAGAVAIGGRQTGIYPHESPGGWNIVGRTPLRLFDPGQAQPALLQAGDNVRFRSITREEFIAQRG
ncbi:MAG: 5-oxoprolinase subunit PxpB [Chthoniobacterales bacterium]